MNDSNKKTRSLSDLRSKLGRGGAASPSSGHPAPTRPESKPSSGGGRGSIVPPPGEPVSESLRRSIIPGPSVVPPPFARQQKAAKAHEPFAVQSTPREPRDVRIVVDERPVADSEVGRKTRSMQLIGASFVALLSIGLGTCLGMTIEQNKIQKTITADAQAIYEAVKGAQPGLEKAQSLLQEAITASSGGGEGKPVNLKALESLATLKKPIEASAFSRRLYRALNPATVDNLLKYYNNVHILWGTLPELSRRAQRNQAELEQSAAAAAKFLNSEYGCLLQKANDMVTCSLGLINATADGSESKLEFSFPGSRKVEKTIYRGKELEGKGSDMVLIVDKAQSRGVIGKEARVFGSYIEDLKKTDELLKKTVELQGLLLQDLSKIKDISK